MKRLLLAGAFVATVWAANEALTRWGTVPVWPGLEAPAGVWFAGLGFLLRDALQEAGGRAWRAWVIGAILAGALLSWWLGADITLPGGLVALAVASGIAFLFSETADLCVYTPLRERSLSTAVAASQVVGALIDSALFLWLAFGAINGELFAGQVIGKILMVVPVAVALELRRRRKLVTA